MLELAELQETITAAAFLRNAIVDTPWVHIDIAGVAWTQVATKEKNIQPKRSHGFLESD